MNIIQIILLLTSLNITACYNQLPKELHTEIITIFFELNPIAAYENFKTSCILQRVSKEWLKIICEIQEKEINRQRKILGIYHREDNPFLVRSALRESYYLYLYNHFAENPEDLDLDYAFDTSAYSIPLLYSVDFLPKPDDAVDFLIRLGANVNVRNYRNQSPLCLAIKNKYTDVAKKLIEYGAKLSYKENGRWPAFNAKAAASSANNQELVNFIDGFQKRRWSKSLGKRISKKIHKFKEEITSRYLGHPKFD
jgi:hypothetical protein